jgi:ABC-type transport system involved in multi-copper enzyme maturation permease subunit
MITDALALVRADLLKLRRRRGLMALVALIAVGSVALIFTVNAVRHGSAPLKNGPAGGIKNFEDSTDFVGLIGVVVAAMIGATAGAGDAEAGALRDVVATGRSRASLFASRAVAGVALTLLALAAALAVASVASVVLAGSAPAPSLSYIVHRDAAVLAFGALSALMAVGIATFTRSRGPVIAVVIGFGVMVSQILIHIDFLGNLRALLPYEAFMRMIGDSTHGVHPSLTAAVAVTVAWAAASLAAGAWWARRVEV